MDVRQEVSWMLETQRVGVLATFDGGQPYTSLMAFVPQAGRGSLLLVSRRNSRKYRNLTAHPQVALLLDNRTQPLEDFMTVTAVTAVGAVCEVGGEEEESGRRRFILRHPEMEGFVRDPECALFRLQVAEYIVVTAFEEIHSWKP